MIIENSIEIEDPIKAKCTRCLGIIAVYNDKGKLLLKKNPIAFISIYENFFEIKCKNCGELNRIDRFPTVLD